MTYIYDGSLQGLLCCVFESFRCGEMPDDIQLPDAVQLSFLGQKQIMTDSEKYIRVREGIRAKLGAEALLLVRSCYLSALPRKETAVLRFLRFAFRRGPGAVGMLAHPAVNPLFRAQRQLYNETHLYKEFIRFSERGGILTSEIEPECIVLPVLAGHFALRLRSERFLICDRTHDLALAGNQGQYVIVPAEGLVIPEADASERDFQRLWRVYHETAGIAERRNLPLQLSNLPRRYRTYMTEFLAEPDVGAALAAADISV